MTYRKILNMGLDQIQSMKYNDLRKTLSELNKEANRRLEVWKRNTRKNLKPLEQVRIMLSSNKWFKQKQRMTRAELLEQIQDRQQFLSKKTSTVWGARQVEKKHNEMLKNIFQERYDLEVNKKEYNRFTRLKNRFEEMHKFDGMTKEEYQNAISIIREVVDDEIYKNDIDTLFNIANESIDRMMLKEQYKRSQRAQELDRDKMNP